MLITALLTFLIVLFTYFAWSLGFRVQFSKDFPGPPPKLFVGNLFEIVHNAPRILEYFGELRAQYGNTFALFSKGRDVVVVTEPQDIQIFLMERFSNFQRPKERRRFSEVFGHGIFTSNGTNWKHQRATARPMFTKDSLSGMVTIFLKNSKALVKILEKVTDTDELVEVQDLFQRYTLDSIGEIGFGHDIGTLASYAAGSKQKVRFAQAFDATQRFIEYSNRNPIYDYYTPKQYKEDLDYMNTFVLDIIKKAKANRDHNRSLNSHHTDLLSRFLDLKDAEGQPLPNSYLRDVVLNFFIAGRDTTGALLTWTFYMLSQHPDIEERLRKEVNDKLPASVDDFTYENIKTLRYMKNVLKEVLRLYPPVPVDGRRCIKDTTLSSGKVVRKGTSLVYSPYLTHRLEEYWGKDVLEFNPDRFDEPLKHQFQFVPFHAGPQVCLGQNMALTEASILVAVILKSNLQFRVKPGYKAVPKKSIILVADGGLPMTVSRRHVPVQ